MTSCNSHSPPDPPTPRSRRNQHWLISLKSVLLVQVTFGIAYSAFLLLPKYLRVELDASAAEIGRVASISLIVAAAAAPFVGMSARWVQRRTLLGGALVLEAAAGLGFVFVQEVGPTMLVLRALQGLAWVAVFNCTAAIAAEQIPAQRLSQGIGFLGVSMLVTNALAPAVAEPLAESYGWGAVFGVPAVLLLLVLPVVRGLPEPATTHEQNAFAALGSTITPRLGAVYYGAFLMGTGIAVMFTFTQPYALAQGATRVGDFFFGYVAAAVFVRTALSSLPDRIGTEKVATLSLAAYALVVLSAARLEPGTLMITGAGLGLSHGFLYPVLTASGLKGLTPNERTMFLGWLSCSFNAGYAIATLSLGPVADAFGYPTVFVVVGIALATGVPLLARPLMAKVAPS